MTLEKLLYTIPELIVATGRSRSSIYRAMKANELCAQYDKSKPVFSRKEVERWIDSLPTERKTA